MIIGMREITNRGRIGCVVTRYAVINDELVATTTTEDTAYEVERGWLFLGNSAASAEVSVLQARAREDKQWGAQSGTPPVKADGYWGGRNYPAIVVSASELRRVLGVEVGS